MSNNKITTKSYFIKRLRDGGYIVDKFPFEYSEEDKRRWSVLIDNGVSSIIATCHKSGAFSFYDGERFVPCQLQLATDSIEVIIDHLNSRGIVNKHPKYGQQE